MVNCVFRDNSASFTNTKHQNFKDYVKGKDLLAMSALFLSAAQTTCFSQYCFNENHEYGSHSAEHLSSSIHYKSTSFDLLRIILVPTFGI